MKLTEPYFNTFVPLSFLSKRLSWQKPSKHLAIYGLRETEVLVIKLQFVVAHLCAKVTRNKLRGNFFLAKNHALILNKITPSQNDFVPPSGCLFC